MKVFITGVAGFLGSHIADAMIAEGHEVSGIDNLVGGYRENVPKNVDFLAIDCNELSTLKAFMTGMDIVYHCAALAYEGLSVFSPHLINTNIMGAATAVFSAAISKDVKRIVHCSSMARYGAITPPFREYMPCKPRDPYGISKLAAECMLKNLCDTHGVEYVIAVPHNIIGPRQKYDDPYRNVASIMINRNLQGKPAYVYGDGSQRRCFSFVQDCIYCLKRLGFQDDLDGETINIGPDEEDITINELADLIARLTGFEGTPQHIPPRPREVKTALCSSDKARDLLSYQTKTSLTQGLQSMIDYIRERGVKPFNYHLPLEIENGWTPRTWTEQLF
jgi:UDP-glucose 4-epimerase